MENQIIEQLAISFMFFLFGAVLVTKLTDIVGAWLTALPKKHVSIFMGVAVALYANYNIMNIIGIPFGWETSNQIILIAGNVTGILFSGLILSTGANGVHDLLSKLQKSKEVKQLEYEVYKEPPIHGVIEYTNKE